ncbi:MAG TPA: hypothetical protein VF725_16195 [Ktedonobacterales bacterium]
MRFDRMASRGVARRAWASGRALAALLALFVGLLLLDALLYQVTLPVTITSDGASLSVTVGGATRRIPISGSILSVSAPARDPVVHEFQLDGTDSTNNFTLDTAYLNRLAVTPYYQFYAWMRDLDGLSRWRDLCVAPAKGAAERCVAYPPLSGATVVAETIPGKEQRITARAQRPEAPLALDLLMSDGGVVSVAINRNDRTVTVMHAFDGQSAITVAQWYFPTDTAPFAAMTLDFLARVALWALALLGLVGGGEWLLGYALGRLGLGAFGASPDQAVVADVVADVVAGGRGWLVGRWRALTAAIHPIGLLGLAASFPYVVWIALAQYHAQPHIYDAAAYLFGAKTFAAGRLWAPAPPASVAQFFNGPFMVMSAGKWFNQYPPGASLTLAVGVALGAPWLVEPLLGTLALLGVGLVAHRLYGDRRVATLAVLLGAASPFYSYLAASYLSHTIALCYLVWGWWALLRCLADARAHCAPLYAALAGLLWLLAALTRDTSAIFIVVAGGGALWLGWRRGWLAGWRRDWRGPLLCGLALYVAALLGVIVSAAYNGALTGDSAVTPRQLFSPGDRYGFGQGVGFYGQHTLAAGFVNLDQLLVSLAIGLYGWPFYLTLALLLLPFLARRAVAADVVMLLGAAALTFAFVGYFYAGIYLGPRYLYEALPFLLMLTARGWLALAGAGRTSRARGAALAGAPATPSLAAPRGAGALALTSTLALALMACWALYYLPRQMALHTNFTGMAAGVTINTAALAHPPLRNALVVTQDGQLYGYTLFALNDPLLRGNVLYADAGPQDYPALRKAFPTRALYRLVVTPTGDIQFIPIPAPLPAPRQMG